MSKTDFSPRYRQRLALTWFITFALLPLACNVLAQETVVVVVTATGQPATVATDTPIVLPTEVEAPVIQTVIVTQPPQIATPLVQTVVVTQPPQPQAPTPTPLVLRTVPIEGDQDLIQGRILFPDYNPAATTDLVFQAEARNPSIGEEDGAGIANVDFFIYDSQGTEVYHRTEQNAHYCAFSGGEPDCVIFRFADTGFTWPETGLTIQSGPHTLVVVVNSEDGNSWDSQVNFDIELQQP